LLAFVWHSFGRGGMREGGVDTHHFFADKSIIFANNSSFCINLLANWNLFVKKSLQHFCIFFNKTLEETIEE